MQFSAELQVGAIFKMKVYRPDGTLKKETDWFKNLVLNTGLEHLGGANNGAGTSYLLVGTGSSAPEATQTKLDAAFASTRTVVSTTGGRHTTKPYYTWGRRVYRFAQGVAAGNISEMGLAGGTWSNNYTLFNRVLVRDSLGNPTTITVLADEYLEVTVEVRCYFQESFSGSFNLVDKTGAIISTHNYTGKPCLQGNPADFLLEPVVFDYNRNNTVVYSGSLTDSVVSTPSGGWANCTSKTTYPRSYTARAELPFGLDSGNGGSFKSFYLPLCRIMADNFANGYMWELDVPITKTNTQLLSFFVEVTWLPYVGEVV